MWFSKRQVLPPPTTWELLAPFVSITSVFLSPPPSPPLPTPPYFTITSSSPISPTTQPPLLPLLQPPLSLLKQSYIFILVYSQIFFTINLYKHSIQGLSAGVRFLKRCLEYLAGSSECKHSDATPLFCALRGASLRKIQEGLWVCWTVGT